jgi:hypothetical protein
MFHTFDICQSIAEKLQNLNQMNISSLPKNWGENSFADGWPSLSLYFSILDTHFPNQKFDHLAHEHLTLTLSKSHANNSFSLFNGTSGLCFITHLCSQNGTRYKKLLNHLDQQLIEEIKIFLQKSDRSMSDYNLISGISGVLAYLLLRQDDPSLLFYAKQCLSSIVAFLQTKKSISGYTVASWHEESTDGGNGRFMLNSLNGTSGLLSTLALASLDRLYVEGLQEAILSLAEWINSKQINTSEGPMWPAIVSFEEEVGQKKDEIIRFPNNFCNNQKLIFSL